MRTFLAAAFGIALVSGCTESTEPSAPVLEVNVATSGPAADIDPDGYLLSLSSGQEYAIPANGILNITDVPPGVHGVEVSGIAANCTLLAPLTRSVQLWENLAAPTRLAVAARCQSSSGALRVSTKTLGDDADTDGYALNVRRLDGGAPTVMALKANGEATGMLGAGTIEATLGAVSDNCQVQGPNPRSLDIEHAEVSSLSFEIACIPNGSLSVALRTAGTHSDPNGYVVTVRRAARVVAERYAGANATAMLTGIAPGDYEVYLAGVAFYCEAEKPVTAVVRSRETTSVNLGVSCTLPTAIAYADGELNAANIGVMQIDGTSRLGVTSSPGPELDPAWSPDGARLAFTRVQGVGSGISVIFADGSNQVDLTPTTGFDLDSRPDWSPDGGQIVFQRHRDQNTDIWVVNADGSNARRLTSDGAAEADPSWSPDGRLIAFTRTQANLASSIYLMNADGSGAVPLAGTSNGRQPAWSPDGTKLAFARLSEGYWSIEVVSLDDGKSVSLAANLASANDPTWSPDGKAVAYAGEEPGCGYYYYGCVPRIVIVDLDRAIIVPGAWSKRESNPDWRPRSP